MTEMVILIPVMLTMWAGIDYFRSGYARRLAALGQSQTRAWTLAYSNDGSCFAGKEPWTGFTGESAPSSAGNLGGEATTSFAGNTSSSMFMYAHANVSQQMSTKSARWDAGSVGSVKGGSYITCNEVVPDSNGDQNVLTPLWDFVKNIF